MNEVKNVIEVSDENFESTIENGVVLVDFWADWCAPCRMQGPILDEVAEELGGKATIAKINVDYNRKSAEKYSIMSIPTLILFKNGETVQHLLGVQSKETLLRYINQAIES